jgi:hypothetical protein
LVATQWTIAGRAESAIGVQADPFGGLAVRHATLFLVWRWEYPDGPLADGHWRQPGYGCWCLRGYRALPHGAGSYKTPKALVFVEEMPETVGGKVLNYQLRASYADLARARATGLGRGGLPRRGWAPAPLGSFTWPIGSSTPRE